MIFWIRRAINWVRKYWPVALAALSALGAYLLGTKSRSVTNPDREKIKREHEAIRKAIAQEEAEFKAKQAAIDKSVQDKDKRLDDLIKKFPGVLSVVLALLVFLLTAMPIQAQEPTEPIPYDSLLQLYRQALDKIADQAAYIAQLEAGLKEAVDLAKGYRSDWEAQKQLTLNAWDMIAYLKAFIENQQKTIEHQWTVIDRITTPKAISVDLNLTLDKENDQYVVKPGLRISWSP
ncbi:MAG: hypothetical protein PWR07_1125 [Bacillota bacterium]|nr:hypothetical protein [Bacillota bacterium]